MKHKVQQPLTDDELLGGKRAFSCANHPSRSGYIDLGEGTPNRYPCEECWEQIKIERGEMPEEYREMMRYKGF